MSGFLFCWILDIYSNNLISMIAIEKMHQFTPEIWVEKPYFKIYWFFKKCSWGNYYSFSLTTLPPMHVAWGTTPLEVGHSPLETWVAWKTRTLPSGNKSLTVSTLEWCWKTPSKWHGVEHKAQAHLLSFWGREIKGKNARQAKYKSSAVV